MDHFFIFLITFFLALLQRLLIKIVKFGSFFLLLVLNLGVLLSYLGKGGLEWEGGGSGGGK